MKENLITALYERLSRDDDLDGESNSIVNQKLYLQNYADEHGFTNCKHYTDDGWSGGNFDRPGWKSLIADVEAGKVGVILAKDMSRIGRNYLETGFYTEVVFRKHNVRFIAIANGVDNDHPETGEFVPFLNIMNEWYLKDQSKKVTAAYQLRGKSGLPTNNNCLYGYRKDPDIKHHWLVDEEAAAIVRRIYQMACEGHGPSEIARILTGEKVDNPGYYYTKHACGMRSDYTKEAHAHDWNSLTISRILTHQEYLGHTVNFRSGKRYYKDKRRANPPEKLLIFENTHEPIVTKETWELAQCALKSIEYKYDPWGKKESVTGTLAVSVGRYNPFRYRGYIFDEETLMYYLKDRYYYPELRRFINSDMQVSLGGIGISTNLYAYCVNNPVIQCDDSGNKPGLLDSIVASFKGIISDIKKSLNMLPPRQANKLDPSTSYANYNCYGYALKRETLASPSGYSLFDHSVEKVFEGVVKDVGSENIRRLSSQNDPISEHEYLVALRVGTFDYHFMVKQEPNALPESNYEWSHKLGSLEVSTYTMYDDSVPWDFGFFSKYDSEIIYFALQKNWK